MNYELMCYYFGNYHLDTRNQQIHGTGWTEWDLVRRAETRIPDQRQPRKPLWGYDDEANPRDMERKIAAAADHALTGFIFDWYWYNDGPFLERSLDEGFLHADNRSRLKFAIMWANHDWTDIHPAKSSQPQHLLYPGRVTRETWRTIMERCAEKYFSQPNYWKIDDRPYFSIYDTRKFVDSAGSLAGAAEWVAEFRDLAKRHGHKDLWLDLIGFETARAAKQWNVTPVELARTLGADSVGAYVWVHHVAPEFPSTPYSSVREQMEKTFWPKDAAEYGPIPTIPNVTQGWDASPRCCQSDRLIHRGYPWIGIYKDNTPAEFRKALEAARRFIESTPGQAPRLTINAWNEWTEGSYLEPDTEYGLAYLEAIKAVFGK